MMKWFGGFFVSVGFVCVFFSVTWVAGVSLADMGSSMDTGVRQDTVNTWTAQQKFGGGITLQDPYSGTEAELKTTTPTVVGQDYWDETNLAKIVSTGTTNCASFGLITGGATAPTGW